MECETILRVCISSVILLVVILIPIILSEKLFQTNWKGVYRSFQFVLIVIVSIVVFLLIVFSDYIFDIDTMNRISAEIFFNATVNIFVGLFAAFSLAFAILYGQLYVAVRYPKDNKPPDWKKLRRLKSQGILLLLIFTVYSLEIWFFILRPIIEIIN